MRNPKIVVVRYIEQGRRMIVQVLSKTTKTIKIIFSDNIWTTKVCPAMQYWDVITNPWWQTAAILKISVKNRPSLMKFGKLQRILNPTRVTWPKIRIFKIQDDGRPPCWKPFSVGHNSSTDCPISAKFCTSKQNGMPTKAPWLPISKIQHGGRPPFWKSLNRHRPISVQNRPILMKFDTLQQILNPMTTTWPKIIFFNSRGRTATTLKIAFWAITRQQRNFARWRRMACWQRRHDKNC